ncbi:hypothetical protein GCM10028806_33410 [Spirosoma terrae]|uniref:Uncharacterized protein n=1 Tax=Spirosoma terrae TaxID=1968276 RepID=A0A6L9L4Z0_9BACT|nr:hypothetical protein [Spirosoma terrae]NDU95656.1 hypothetical protein [Spirosoma terrae]
MFSFDDVEITESPVFTAIKPLEGGTPNVFLKKWEWTTPAGKLARLELTLERRYKPEGATETVVETSIILFNDPSQLQSGGDKRQAISLEQYGRIILAYRKDLTLESLKKQIGKVPTWEEFTKKAFALLPTDFATKESTWKLIFFQGKGPMSIDTKYCVKLGTHTFPWNKTYDHTAESEENRNNRRSNSGGTSQPDDESHFAGAAQGGNPFAGGTPSDDDLFN